MQQGMVGIMNKKPSRLFNPNIRLYFILLMLFAIATLFFGRYYIILAAIQGGVLVLLFIYWRVSMRTRTRRILDYLESVSDGLDPTVRDTPLPIVVFNSETNEIIWANEKFFSITDMRVPLFELLITDVVPDFDGDWLIEGKNECLDPVSVNGRKYKVYGSVQRTELEHISTTYWVDITELDRISNEYHDSRPVFTIIVLDNYEEWLKGLTEKERSILLSDVDEKISEWARVTEGYLCRFSRDRYFLLFEERKLGNLVESNFFVLDSVRSAIGANGVHATLSIGIGKDGKNPLENHRFASLSLEMALSRGGDQAVIRNRYGFEFFGGHAVQFENRTKVRSRIMANALGELLRDASTILVMGHKFADFDSVGAACGVCCMARAKGKKARIVIDLENNVAQDVIDLLLKEPEYEDTFISEQEAVLAADGNTLLVVVDTTRPEKVESESLLLSCSQIAVVDHHRRAASYIDNAAFNFHEPYASSTSELITEMLQYLVEAEDILSIEANALLAGMVLDTKGFTINTGSRTFEAAAFLKRIGADSIMVKKIMQSNIETATSRYDIMRNAEIYRDNIALASAVGVHSRISVAQAADELLNVKGVYASFVVAQDGSDVFVSGRSIGDLNVQVVLEKLGGGGSQATAGLQVQNASASEIISNIKLAIDECYDK